MTTIFFIKAAISNVILTILPQFQHFARIMVGLNFSLPLFLNALIWSTQSYNSKGLIKEVFKCLGEEHMIFLLEEHTSGNFCETVLTWSLTVITIIFMSNIPDFYFTYFCFKEVESSNENAKNMISNEAYLKRKR